MASPRRIGTEDSKTRAVMLDVTARLMLSEGYAAVSSRRVAAEAGVKPALVHYYFRTMDDLFLAVLRRGGEANLERQKRALASDRPLRALWELNNDPHTALLMEFTALANHRDAIRAEMAAYGERFRVMQVDALSHVLASYGVDPDEFPAVVVLMLMTSISRFLVMEKVLGVTVGHAETDEFVERYLRLLEGESSGPPASGPPAAPDRA